MKKRPKLDKNQKEIEKDLIKLGFTVISLASIGKGVPDLIVGKDNQNILVEIKNGKNKLTDDQKKFKAKWQGNFFVCYNTDDVLFAFFKLKSDLLWKI